MTASTAMLSLEQTPPMAVPFRFFLTAPLFGIAACLLAGFTGPDILLSRWQPALLAVTHLFTLGYLAMVMCGAMLQLLPVLAGVQVVRNTALSAAVHLLLVAGTIALALAFVSARPVLFGVAIAALSAAVLLFIAIIGRALRRARSLHVFTDSLLVVKQMTGGYTCHTAPLYSLNWTCRKLARSLIFTIAHVPRHENAEANRLANDAVHKRRHYERFVPAPVLLLRPPSLAT